MYRSKGTIVYALNDGESPYDDRTYRNGLVMTQSHENDTYYRYYRDKTGKIVYLW